MKAYGTCKFCAAKGYARRLLYRITGPAGTVWRCSACMNECEAPK